jgi:CDP-diacylglycerol--glycerol-3-phosphate 3-phosphatidyltransferase
VKLNLPNALTGIRIALIPAFVIVYYLPGEWSRPLACYIFTAAALTDWMDGYLARKLDQTSKFGAFLDPVADKLIVATALVLLVSTEHALLSNWRSLVLTLAAAVIIGREITISALREWMAEYGAGAKVAVSAIGKFKTIAQMFGLAFMIHLKDFLYLPVYEMGFWLLLIAAGLTLWSMVDYLKAAWPALEAAD